MLAELKRLELASIDETLQLVPQEAEHERGCGVPPIFGENIPIYRINVDLEIAGLQPRIREFGDQSGKIFLDLWRDRELLQPRYLVVVEPVPPKLPVTTNLDMPDEVGETRAVDKCPC